MASKTAIIKALRTIKPRSKWGQAVRDDAIWLADQNLEARKNYTVSNYKSDLLSGARDWKEFSWGGCALAYDVQIAKHYSTPSELKKTKGGMRMPNSREQWLDVQARALYQASNLIYEAIRTLNARKI